MNKRWWYLGALVLYQIRKDEGDELLPFLVFQRHIVNVICLKYSKEGRLSSNHVGTDDKTKNYQAQPEHRRTQNLFKHLRWSVFV